MLRVHCGHVRKVAELSNSLFASRWLLAFNVTLVPELRNDYLCEGIQLVH